MGKIRGDVCYPTLKDRKLKPHANPHGTPSPAPIICTLRLAPPINSQGVRDYIYSIFAGGASVRLPV